MNACNTGDNCNFTYNHYVDTVKLYKGDIILRHDVDFDIMKALFMALEEHRDGIKSKYFFMVENEYYNVFSPFCAKHVETIQELGHEVGIHYNPKTPESLMFEFKKLFKIKNPKLTAHMPATTGEYWANEYKPEGYKYLSDSGMNWREGCFCQHLDKPKLYVNTHPEWWANWTMTRKEIFESIIALKNLATGGRLREMYDEIQNVYLPKVRKEWPDGHDGSIEWPNGPSET